MVSHREDVEAHSGGGWLVRIRLGLTCLSIAANAICAGGIFTFPLLSPALSSHLKLTQPQLTTIVLAGLVGQYPFAAIVGRAIDTYGPWACSLVSAFLFSGGFGLFALEIAKTPDDITEPSRSSYIILTVLFFIAGLGTVFSYFSSLFAASKNFPNYIGVASGSSMALFGLSPLFLSVIASNLFTDPTTGLDVTRFMTFLSILTGVVHIFGAINLRTPIPSEATASLSIAHDAERGEPTATESTPLLASDSAIVKPVHAQDGTVLDLVKDPYFWVLAVVVFSTLGPSEMVISNIGTIVASLPSASTRTATGSLTATAIADVTATQVRILSLSNTLSRLAVGPIADFMSPVASYLPDGVVVYPRKHHFSRIAFLSASTLLLACTFTWLEIGIRSQAGLWALSVGTGMGYATVFTVLPSIMSSIWGLPNLGRNFGVITYAPFLGTPLFSYIYAFVSARHAGEASICYGTQCWRSTFWITTTATLISFVGTLVLWRHWKGRV